MVIKNQNEATFPLAFLLSYVLGESSYLRFTFA